METSFLPIFCSQNISVTVWVVTLWIKLCRVGDKLAYHRLPWKEPPAPWKLEVLYEDDYLVISEFRVLNLENIKILVKFGSLCWPVSPISQLAVNKPAGLQVLPGGLYQQRTVLTQLKWRYHHGDIALGQPSPVHRLGRGTSGLFLFMWLHLAD